MVSTRAPPAAIASTAHATANRRKRRHEKRLLDRQPQHKGHALAAPPPGYSFLGVGYPELSNRCKELSIERNAKITIVHGQTPEEFLGKRASNRYDRIGYLFRTDVFDEVCSEVGYSVATGKLVKDSAQTLTTGFELTLAKYGADMDQLGAAEPTDDQSERVKGTMRELFPNMPEESLNAIFETAWQKGAETVGNAHGLPLARRVQLAVLAHIRHTYTDYDRLLTTVGWHHARKYVQPDCQSKMNEWRGEDEPIDDNLDDALKEWTDHLIRDLTDEESPPSEPEDWADNEISSSEAEPTGYPPVPMPDTDSSERDIRYKLRQKWDPLLGFVNHDSITGERRRRAGSVVAGPEASVESRHPLGLALARLFARGPWPAKPLPEIIAPTDVRGRAPRSFVQEGIQYTRVPREQLAAMAAPATPQPAPQLARYYDLEGNEVFIDASTHRLDPVSPSAAPHGSAPLSLGDFY